MDHNRELHPNLGDIFVFGKSDRPHDALLATSFNLIALAGATTTLAQIFTVPTGRGVVKAIEVIAGSTTIADLAATFISVSVNDTSCLQNIPATKFIPTAMNSRSYRRIQLPEKSLVNLTVINGSANAFSVAVILYFQDPYVD